MKTIIPTPTLGRTVLYVLTEADVKFITESRQKTKCLDGAFCLGGGNPVQAGEVYPAIIVRHWGGDRPTPETAVNLKVLLDGADHIWVTSRCHDQAKQPGTFHWPVYPIQGETRLIQAEPLHKTHPLELCENGEIKTIHVLVAPGPLPSADPAPEIVIPLVCLQEMRRLALALCYQIEACGASPELTKAGVMACSLNDALKEFVPQLVPCTPR